ncbi:MAG: hypothetical protein ABI577_17720 [bacterium]
MTMMALTRKRHRGLHLWVLALGLLIVGVSAVSLTRSSVHAISEGDVQFAVTQSPAGGSTVQVGSTVSLDVQATVTNAPVGIPLYFEFDYPAGLNYANGYSTPPGVTCTDNTPSVGVVRCDYGLVLAGPRVPLTLNFSVTSNVVTTAAQAMIRGGASDGGPDTAADGSDDSFAGAGIITVFSSSIIVVGGSGAPATVFEGFSTSYTAALQNSSSVSTGSFNSAVVFTNGIVTGVTCTTSGSNGFGSGSGTPTATCTGSSLAPGETLTITATVAAANTANGADITAQISAPALGISTAGSGVAVDEVGLDSNGGSLSVGVPINVCTGVVPADVGDDAAAGAAQPHSAAMIGQTSSNITLQVVDFQVAGPGVGTISAATGCATDQSGVRFTPSVGGSYSVTALYNTGGTNVLALAVGGVSNPVPSISLLGPSTATAGSAQFTMTVTGSNFIASSIVNWNGAALATTYSGSSNSLTATVPAANVASVGTANVTVTNPGPGGGTSGLLTFAITAAPNPVPTVTSLAPNSVGAGAAQFSMTVTGTNFVAGSQVMWDGVALSTVFGSATSLTATVPAAKVASAGAANVTVFNPAPGGGTAVTPQTFTITSSAAKLAFTTQPGAGVAGAALAAQPVVAVQTSANATVTSDSATVVTLALNGSGTLTCTGGLSKTSAAGLANFAGCSVSPAGAGYTITASATGLTSATSGTFDVSAAPPTTSTQVTVTNPTNAPIARSRLLFAIGTGSLDASSVSFIIKRKADGKYFNVETGDWQTELVLNTAAHGAGTAWAIAIEGEARREFAGTVITLEARVTAAATVYVNATIPELNIR